MGVISYTFTDPRIPGAGQPVYRRVTTLLDPFVYPAKEVAVLYHERWHVEVVIDETRTHLRLSARTWRSLTPEGVLQELYKLLLAHLVVSTLMLRAAEQAQIAPTQIRFTETIRIMDEHLVPCCGLGALHRHELMQGALRRHHLMEAALIEISQQRLPKQAIRIQARVVKGVRSRYKRKTASHRHAPPSEPSVYSGPNEGANATAVPHGTLFNPNRFRTPKYTGEYQHITEVDRVRSSHRLVRYNPSSKQFGYESLTKSIPIITRIQR